MMHKNQQENCAPLFFVLPAILWSLGTEAYLLAGSLHQVLFPRGQEGLPGKNSNAVEQVERVEHSVPLDSPPDEEQMAR